MEIAALTLHEKIKRFLRTSALSELRGKPHPAAYPTRHEYEKAF